MRASDLVDSSCRELGYDLTQLVALSSVWIHPDVYAMLQDVDGVWYPDRRRANLGLRVNGNPVEKLGDVIDGITLDNNTYANNAFKVALGVDRREFTGFHICHVWEKTAYDAKCYTNLANLVALPAELSSLSDHHAHIASCLRFRAYELYGWKPANEQVPVKPAGYPERWRDPEPVNDDARRATMRRVGKRLQIARHSTPIATSREFGEATRPSTTVYRSGVVRDRDMLVAAFYLSKFDHERLQIGNQGETLDAIARALGVNRNSLRQRRDYFDSHTGSHRVGWKTPLSGETLSVFHELASVAEPELRKRVLTMLRG